MSRGGGCLWLAAWLLAYPSWLLSLPGTLQAVETKRPNFLFILVDDQSPFDLSIYNAQSELRSPNIDRLAREGMVFDGAYHQGSFIGAVCTPSRHMIMCGRTVWHLPISPGAIEQGRCPPDIVQQTIPAVLNRAEYDTMRTCKPGNSYRAANQLYAVLHEADKRGGTPDTGSAWHGDRVMEFLQRRQAENDTDPFFIEFGLSHPHDPRDGTPELLEKYGAVNHTDQNEPPAANSQSPRLPSNYLPAHPFPHGHPDLRDEVAVSGVWKRRDERTVRNELGRQFACSENIDVQIGRVLKQLETMDELNHTYVIYTSDHGIALGRHGLMGKQNLYQHSWRVPLIVKGPGIKPGSRVEGNIYLLDLLATFCDLAGIPIPDTNEGLSFKSVLHGDQDTVRDVLYGVYAGGTKPGMRCIKQGDWKLILYDVLEGKVREKQLFNLADNPHEFLPEHHDPAVIALTGQQPRPEQVNLAGDPRYAKKLSELEALLLMEMQRLHDPGQLWIQQTRN